MRHLRLPRPRLQVLIVGGLHGPSLPACLDSTTKKNVDQYRNTVINGILRVIGYKAFVEFRRAQDKELRDSLERHKKAEQAPAPDGDDDVEDVGDETESSDSDNNA